VKEIWTRNQRGVVAGLIAGLLIYFSIFLWLNPAQVPRPLLKDGPRSSEDVSRLDPNTAPVQELATLPQLGEKRAREIVAYRQIFVADHPGQSAFNEPKDLLKVKGIAYSMMQGLEPYLVFPARSATSVHP
jgi:hypothetical protein